MSGDFPDDWFRPVVEAPTAPDDEASAQSPSSVDTPADPVLSTDPGAKGADAEPPWSSGSNVASTGGTTTIPGRTTSTSSSSERTGTGSGKLPRVESPPTSNSGRVVDTGDLDSGPPSGPEPGVIPVIAAPGALVVGRVDGHDEHADPNGSTLHPGLIVVVVLVLSLAVGLVIGLLVVGARPPEPTPTTPAPTPSVPAASARQPYTGAIAQVAATKATAQCTSAPKPDIQGNLVEYSPDNLIDEDSGTAWRCNGDGVGKTLTFTFAPGTKLVGVGVLNGYAKSVGEDRYYDQFRRVLVVRWDMPDGTFFLQYLSDNNMSVQRVMIPITTVDGPVTMTIEEATPPGVKDNPERDAVLISTVEFWTAPS